MAHVHDYQGSVGWMDEWIEAYLNELPNDFRILAQVENKWKEKGLNALSRWRHSGSSQDLEFISFCDCVVERLSARHA